MSSLSRPPDEIPLLAPTAPAQRRSAWSRWPFGPRRSLAFVLAAVPLYAIASQAVAVVRYGVDIPYWDDWNQYVVGKFGSLNLGFLFAPRAGTIYPVGKALDSLDQLFLGGNYVVYQFLTLTFLLGLLLFFQYRLLRQTLGGLLLTAAVLLLALPMLRVDTYWGLISLAYQQGLPTVALLGALWLLWRQSPLGRGSTLLIAGLATAGGLSYISGAFAFTTLGITLLVLGRLAANPLRSHLTRGGVVMAAFGAITLVIQLGLVFGTPARQSVFTSPLDLRFWFYYAGEIAGSLALRPADPSPGALVVRAIAGGIATAAGFLAVLRSFRWLARHRAAPVSKATGPVMLVALSAVVAVYLAIVAAARTDIYVGPGATLSQIFTSGLTFEHPFWVTLVWPWVGVSFIQVLRNRRGLIRRWPQSRRWLPYGTAVIAVALIGASASQGSFDYQRWYSSVEYLKTDLVSCIQTDLNRGVPVDCQPGDANATDLTNAVLGAMLKDASFTRNVQFLPTPDDAPALFRLADGGPSAIRMSQGSTATQTSEGWTIAAQNSAIAAISTGQGPKLATCHVLEVTAIMRAQQQLILHLFWAPADQPQALVSSAWHATSGGTWASMHYFLISLTGFADSLRLHFIQNPQNDDMKDLQVRCRITA